MTLSGTAPASHHQENWALRYDTSAIERVLAGAVRPMIRTVKRDLLALGAGALGATEPGTVRGPAGSLVRDLSAWEHALRAVPEGDRVGWIRREVCDATAEMRVWAAAVLTEGRVSAEAARGLQRGYRRFRSAASALWHSEFVPESHAPDHREGFHG
jgi:hypothetical protein